MAQVGDLVWVKGQVVGVLSKILRNEFAVQVSGPAGVTVVNWEDVDQEAMFRQSQSLPQPKETTNYIEMYKVQ